MINKKNELGKHPHELGKKDAIHVAIVSVRAARPIEPGERCGLNERQEAVPDRKGPGVADPFLKSRIMVGENFWLVLAQDQVPNVQHVWEHPDVDFSPPTEGVKKNPHLEEHAEALGITYEQLMEACSEAVNTYQRVPYPGNKTEEEIEENYDKYDIFCEWADEVGYEFENMGTSCCPEYDYPDTLFVFEDDT